MKHLTIFLATLLIAVSGAEAKPLIPIPTQLFLIMKFVPFTILLLAFPCLVPTLAVAEEVRLSSLDLRHVQQRDGKPAADLAVGGKPLAIAGKGYAHGVGTQAPSVLHLDLKGGSSRFTAQVGVQDDGNAKNKIGAEFIIEGDDKVLWTSPLMRDGTAARAVDLDLTGVKKLALKVNGGFDSAISCMPDKANWAEAAFHVTGAKPVTTAAPATTPRWIPGEGLTTEWRVGKDRRLPHADFIEQGGLKVGQVVHYRVDGKHALSMKRSVVWPSVESLFMESPASACRRLASLITNRAAKNKESSPPGFTRFRTPP